jgi:hypothetical protein
VWLFGTKAKSHCELLFCVVLYVRRTIVLGSTVCSKVSVLARSAKLDATNCTYVVPPNWIATVFYTQGIFANTRVRHPLLNLGIES